MACPVFRPPRTFLRFRVPPRGQAARAKGKNNNGLVPQREREGFARGPEEPPSGSGAEHDHGRRAADATSVSRLTSDASMSDLLEGFGDGWGVMDVETDGTDSEAVRTSPGGARRKGGDRAAWDGEEDGLSSSFGMEDRPLESDVADALGALLSEELLDRAEVDAELTRAAASLAQAPRGVLKGLERQQVRARVDAEADRVQRRQKGSPYKVHKKLRIIGGDASGTWLWSPSDQRTRPMMEKVRAATFSMLLSQVGGDGTFEARTRWLDLFAGTGSVGLEAVSRGAGLCHFVELDPFVIGKVLQPNIDACASGGACVVHNGRAEEFLQRAERAPSFAGGPFDFISACPPYEKVSYPELFEMLDRSPLLHAGSFVVVEYPLREVKNVPDTLGPLVKFRDRRYGRTFLAIWGPKEILGVA